MLKILGGIRMESLAKKSLEKEVNYQPQIPEIISLTESLCSKNIVDKLRKKGSYVC